jgi:hypothetical protein
MIIISFALLIVLFALVCWYPPIAVITFAMTDIAGDGFGLNNYLRVIGLENLAIGINGLVFIASLICSYRILATGDGKYGERARFSVAVVLAIAVWIPFSVLAKGGAPSFALGSLMYTGVLIAPIVIAYAHKPAARAIFAGLIVIQLSLAALVVLEPGSVVGVLRGTLYHSSLGELAGVSQQFNGEVSRTGDQPRLFAQFSDPNTYGLYAVAGLALGFFLMMRSGTHSRRVAGIAIISLAVFGWITTFSRGATLGLLIGALLVVVGQAVSRRITTGGVLTVALVALGALAFAAVYASLVQRTAENLSVASINSRDVDSRLDAARVGWQALASDPVFGVPLDFIWPNDIPPHQLPIYFAAQYGLPSGLLVCVLLWPILGTTRRFLFSRISPTAQWDMALAVVVGWILLGTAASNNLSAPALFWVLWAIAAIPWLNEPRDGSSMRKDAIRFDLRGARRLAMPVRRGAV